MPKMIWSGKVIPLLIGRNFAGLASGRVSYRMAGATMEEAAEHRIVRRKAAPCPNPKARLSSIAITAMMIAGISMTTSGTVI